MNYCVTEKHEEHEEIDGVLNVLAPFSAATQNGNGLEFYKRLRKEKAIVKTELEQITTNLITRINATLPKIISLADPYAHPMTISETDISEFSLRYLFRFLNGLTTTSGGVIHVCPYSSALLEKYGLARVQVVTFSPKPYATVLSEYAKKEQLMLTGHQCVRTKTVDKVFVLHLSRGVYDGTN